MLYDFAFFRTSYFQQERASLPAPAFNNSSRKACEISGTSVIKTKAPAEDIVEAYKDFYRDAAFTHYSDKAIDLKQVVNTNKALVHVDCFEGKVLVTSAIDNLLKGAVGQAVQNMNLMFGIDEHAGLRLKASAF